MNAETNDILEGLAAIRTKVRLRLLLYGVCVVLAGGCLSFLTVVTLDWLFRLPPLLRLLGTTLFIVGFGLATLHWVVRPQRMPLPLRSIAARLEGYFGGFDDRLSSAVSFLSHAPPPSEPGAEPPYSSALIRAVIDRANRQVAATPLDHALTVRPLLRQALVLALGVLITAAVVSRSPEWIDVGVQRFVRPFGDARWPRHTEIMPLTEDLMVPIGEPATVEMRVTRGWHGDLRGVVQIVDSEGEKTSLAMNLVSQPGQGDQNHARYRCTIEAVSSNLLYWFEAGDDDTRSRVGRIAAVHRPTVANILVALRPPPYAPDVEPVLIDLKSTPLSVVPGSTLDVQVRSTKPVGCGLDGKAKAWLERMNGERVALVMTENSGGPGLELEGVLPVHGDDSFRVHLTDRFGFGNLPEQEYRIVTRPDAKPSVALLDSQTVTHVTPRGSVAIAARAQDDLGLTDLRLVGECETPQATIDLPLFEHASVTRTDNRRTARVNYVWELESLGLQPGSTVRYRIEATDNRSYGDLDRQVGASATLRLKVISETRFEEQLRNEFTTLQRRIRRALLEQQTIRADTNTLSRSSDAEDDAAHLTDASIEESHRLAARQDRLARHVIDLARRFDAIEERIQRNRIGDSFGIDRLRLVRTRLLEVANEPMQNAAQALEQIANADASLAQSQHAASAERHQEHAVQILRDVLRLMDDWGDFQTLVAQAQDLARSQQRIRRDTGSFGKQTLGKRAQELSAERQRGLRRLERRQHQLGDEFQQLLQRLRSFRPDPDRLDANLIRTVRLRRTRERQAPSQTDDSAGRAGRARLFSALRTAAANQIAERLQAAISALHENRLAAAGIEQRGAEAGLRKLLAALQQQRLRQLAELVKRLERAEQAAAELLRQQREIRNATAEAFTVGADREAFVRLAGQQAQLAANTAEFGKDLAAEPETAEPGDLLRQAATSMTAAQHALVVAPDSPDIRRDQRVGRTGLAFSLRPALRPQQLAVELLEDAVMLLEQRAAEAAHAGTRQALAIIRHQLEASRNAQNEINNGTAQVTDAVATRGQLDRATARRIVGLAQAQGTLHGKIGEIRRRLNNTVVYKRVLQKAADGMQESQGALKARRLGVSLSSRQRRIVQRLDQLIRALLDAEALPPLDEFAETDSSGGGAGSKSGGPAIPTVAELLMLKTMQVDLLAETVELGASQDFDREPSEHELAAIETLGKRQAEIRRLAELVTKKAGQQSEP